VFGDAVGNLLVAPLIMVAFATWPRRLARPRAIEGAVLLSAIVASSAVVFRAGGWRYPYLVFPFLLAASLRFRQLGAAAGAFVVGALATWGTVAGSMPLGSVGPTSRVQIIQALVSVVAISLLVLGATLAEKDEAGESLAQTAARLHEAQSLAHVGSWEWELETGRVVWSDELYRICGLAPHSVPVDLAFFLSRIHAHDRDRIARAMKTARETGRPFAFEHRVVLPDGSVRVVRGHGRVVLGDAGSRARVLGTAQDVTEQRHAESLRDDILSTVSHELRTPLASVLGYAMILQERGSNLGRSAVEGMLEQIVEQARRIDRLLSDLVDVDRLRHGIVNPIREPTDLNELVDEVVAPYKSDRPLTVDAESITANVDRAAVERIVDNLVRNAVKHTPRGTPVALSMEQAGRDVLLVVDDDGPGIPDHQKANIFEIFDRGAGPQSHGGTGIGLSLVARFASIHGGRAWVEDNPSGGASFRVLLPDCALSQETERLRLPSGAVVARD